jgi:heme-degrading monooxygenase HmoA
MIVEIGTLIALPGRAGQLREALQKARHVLSRADGYRGSVFYQSVEDASSFCLTVWWDDVAAHMKKFREGPLFVEWRKHLVPFLDVSAIKPGISFSHYGAIAGDPKPPADN